MRTVITIYTNVNATYKNDFNLRAFMLVKPNENKRYFIEETCFDDAKEIDAEGFISFIRKNDLIASENSIVLPL